MTNEIKKLESSSAAGGGQGWREFTKFASKYKYEELKPCTKCGFDHVL